MVNSSKAIFVSYASQDSEVALRICEALRAAGLHVWFDRSELRGGDAWDATIRRQIRECGLFLPLISTNTDARSEGYFRREWNLAVDRTLDLADDHAFLLPVLIDETAEQSARVPDKFRERQWTRLIGGDISPAFVERLRRLLSPDASGIDVAEARHARLPGNLPVSVDAFIARERELAEVVALFGSARLVTLTGAGGTGKTRLATEAAQRLRASFRDGAWLAELAPVTHAEAVPYMLADLISAVQQPGKTIVQSVVDSLRHRAMLLVLDNCEHVLDAAAELAAAIAAHCAGVRILATSRESLGIRGEHVLRLQSLTDADGAELFRDRALAAGASGDLPVSTLARLSQRLDGMPLAIELAAARCGSMNPEEIERRLDDRFRLLRGSSRGRTERHQTLHNTVAWSYGLLSPLEQRVFARLSVFAGGFTLEAAQAVASDDGTDAPEVEDAVVLLVGRSMVLASDTRDGTRYRLLETLRQFGEEELVRSGDAAKVRERHLAYFAGFMTLAWKGLWSSDDASWIRAVGCEFENLRIATYAAIDSRDREALAALLKPHFWWAWHSMRYEVADWAEASLEIDPEPEFARAVAVHLRTHGGRPADAVRLATEQAHPANPGDPDSTCMAAWSQWNRAMIECSPELDEWMHRAIVAGQRTGNPARANALRSIEVVFKVMAGEMDEARRIAFEAHEAARPTGNQAALCWTHFFMGRAYSDIDPPLAMRHFNQSLEISTRHNIPLLRGIAATEAAVISARTDDPTRAGRPLAHALRVFINSGDRLQLWTSAHHLAFFLVRAGRADDARGLWRELRSRPAFAARHHRDELAALLGEPEASGLSDDELVERIRGILDQLDRGPPRRATEG
jgi:predicted ATPase